MVEGSQIVTTNDRHLFHIRVADPWRSTSWAMLGQSWGHLCISLELLWSTLDNCWQCWGHLGVILESLGGYLGPSWGYLGLCWGYVGAILGLLGASSSTYSSSIEHRYLIEMLTSLSLCRCRARMQHPKTTMSLDIASAHFIDIMKSLSFDPCRAQTHQP